MTVIREAETMPDSEVALILKKHDKELEIHEDKIEDHTLQIRVQAEQIRQLQDNAIKLENVVISENRETRMTITQSNQQLHTLVNNLLGYKTGQNQLKHSLRMAKWESLAKIIGILAGSGGIIYWLVTEVLSK